MAAHPTERRRGLTSIDGAVALMVVLLIVQMWLLTATLNAALAGDSGVALPAALVAAVLFAGCLALYLFVERVDAAVRGPRSEVPGPTSEG